MAGRKLNIAVCAICRNELDYVEEWVSHYRAIGFDSIYIYDNVSDDGTSELLSAMDAVSAICRVHWPRKDGIPPQRDAYGDFLARYSSKYDYVLICDLDEFLVVKEGTIRDLINEAEGLHGQVGAIAIPWMIFGSGGAEKKESGLVLERFKYSEVAPARTVKTIFAPKHVYNMRTHICDLLGGVYLDNRLELAQWDQKMPIKLRKVSAGKALIHHYYTKSREEWLRRRAQPKADRGGLEHKRIEEFEKFHALTNKLESGCRSLESVKEKIDSLRHLMAEARDKIGLNSIELIARDGEWIFLLVKTDIDSNPFAIRMIGDDAQESIFYTKPLASNMHLLTIKTKWRSYFSSDFELSAVGYQERYKFGVADIPPAENAFLNLISYTPMAEEHIFSVFLKAITRENLCSLLKSSEGMVIARNFKFSEVLSALRNYSANGDRKQLKASCSNFDSEFTKKITSRHHSPFLSSLVC